MSVQENGVQRMKGSRLTCHGGTGNKEKPDGDEVLHGG
jgi:hypothetical protein